MPTYQAYLHTYQRQRTGTLSAYLTHFPTAYLTSQLTSHPYQLANLPTTNLPTYVILAHRGVEPYRQSQRLLYRERVSDFQYEPFASEDDGATPRSLSSHAPG